MKNRGWLIPILLAFFSIGETQLKAQSTTANNNRLGGHFLGWDNTGLPGSLQIRNDFTGPLQPIEFYLGGTAG